MSVHVGGYSIDYEGDTILAAGTDLKAVKVEVERHAKEIGSDMPGYWVMTFDTVADVSFVVFYDKDNDNWYE